MHLIKDTFLEDIVNAIKQKNKITIFNGSDMAKEIKKQPMVNWLVVGESEGNKLYEVTAEDLEGVTYVRSYGFMNCNWLKMVTLPTGCTMGNNVFNGCDYLEEVVLPSTIRSTGTAGFNNCISLRKINTENFTSIGSSGFKNCSTLERLDFNVLVTISATAFEGCTALKTLVLKRNSVCTLTNINAFSNTPIASGAGFVYVPDGLVEAYKTAENWTTYANSIKPLSELEGGAE